MIHPDTSLLLEYLRLFLALHPPVALLLLLHYLDLLLLSILLEYLLVVLQTSYPVVILYLPFVALLQDYLVLYFHLHIPVYSLALGSALPLPSPVSLLLIHLDMLL
ncbi:hypothetical protein QUH70_09815, partial [Staphylococcus felis]